MILTDDDPCDANYFSSSLNPDDSKRLPYSIQNDDDNNSLRSFPSLASLISEKDELFDINLNEWSNNKDNMGEAILAKENLYLKKEQGKNTLNAVKGLFASALSMGKGVFRIGADDSSKNVSNEMEEN